MAEAHEELLAIADRMDRLDQRARERTISEPINALRDAAAEVGRSFSGSWQGYHAYVYYEGLEPRPPGAQFSQEWGLMERGGRLRSVGRWHEFDPEEVKELIRERAGGPNLDSWHTFFEECKTEIDRQKAEVLSILSATPSDSFLNKLKEEIEPLEVVSPRVIPERIKPTGQFMTRDTVVIGQGMKVPPHISLLSEAYAYDNVLTCIKTLGEVARKAGSHISRMQRNTKRADLVGTNVFIGHGRSPDWRELKDFIEKRLNLPTDEFNRVPVAGVTNTARLSEMLKDAAFAFLVMTAEDELKDNKIQARMNVIHEAGLFQGRLGFERAIVLLEEGCEEFSNIAGLGQLRFQKGQIRAIFEDVRQVLEREGVLS